MLASSVVVADSTSPAVIRVDVRGPLEQRAGYADECGGWSDGHDAIAERMIAALAEGDIVAVWDSPGGACAGGQEAIRRVLDAKAQYGRRITSYCDETIASMALWWAACISNEIFVPAMGVVGSIGARMSHESIAGLLEREGIQVTHFAWPNDGKVAGAPDMPLSDLAVERARRDVTIAGEAFCAAICAARGLERQAIVDMGADCYTGQTAVDKGLADGVASLEEVQDYALTMAGATSTTGTGPDAPEGDAKSSARRVTSRSTRMSGIRGAAAEEPEDGAPEGLAPSSLCATCGSGNADTSKFCAQCGGSLAARPLAEDEPVPVEDEETEEDDSDEPAPPAARRANPTPGDEPAAKAARSYATLAAAAGLSEGSSELAIRSSVIQMRQTIDRAYALTGARTLAALDGCLIAMADDSRDLAKTKADMRAMRATGNARERMDLLNKLGAANLPGYMRGDLFVDKIEGGERVVKPAPQYAEMKLGTLRSIVERKTAGRVAARPPFEPDHTKAPNQGAGVTPSDERVAAKHNLDPKQVAASRAALDARRNGVGAEQ